MQANQRAEPKQRSNGLVSAFLGALPGLLIAALILVRMVMTGPAHVAQGELYDTDSFTHVVRLRELLATGGWHHGLFLRDNAPFGMVLHWTKAYDIFYLILAAPIAAFVGWDPALHVIAVILGPLSITMLVIAAVAAVLPVCDRLERQVVGLTVALAPMVLQYGEIGDSDHHVLIVGCWVATLGLLLRLILGRDKGNLSLMAGLMAAVSLWLAVECILALALGITLLGLSWIRAGAPLRKPNLRFAFSFCGCLIALLAFDPPYGGFLSPDLDRLSIAYVAFSALLTLLWVALAMAPQAPDCHGRRFGVAAGGAVICTAVLVSIFSEILTPERTIFLRGLGPDWTASVGEALPAYNNGQSLILTASVPLMALAFALYRAWRDRHSSNSLAWLFFAIMLIPMLALGLRHIRFMIYPEVFSALAIAKMIGRSRPWLRHVASTTGYVLEPLMALAIVLALPSLTAKAWSLTRNDAQKGLFQNDTSQNESNCRVQSIAISLNDVAFMDGSNKILMTTMNVAPEVLYWSGNRAVAGPYHRNVDGIRDEFNFFTSEDDAEALAILTRRDASYVLVCPGELATSFPDRADGQALSTRLLQGKIPDWLALRPWPAGTTSDLRLYRVRPAGSTQP